MIKSSVTPFISVTKDIKEEIKPQLEFPPEIVEMIFMHCDDLLELTLVSPAFNDVISKSPSLMKNVTVKWMASSTKNWGFARKLLHRDCKLAMHSELMLRQKHKWWDCTFWYSPCQYNPHILLQSCRKYRSLNLLVGEQDQWPLLSVFIDVHKETLKELEIISSFALEPMQHFKTLSTLSENLRKLSTHNLPEEIASFGDLEFPNLEEWEWSGEHHFMFHDWKTPKLRKFAYLIFQSIRFGERPNSSNNLANFLRNQPLLEDLELKTPHSLENFFREARLSPLPLTLTQLEVGFQNCSLLLPFLESQKKSLKFLSLERLELDNEDLNRILALELKELKLIEVEFESFAAPTLKNHAIETLYFVSSELFPNDEEVIIAFIKSCPNLETLCIDGYEILPEISQTIAASKIKNLNLTDTFFAFPLEELDQYPSLENFSTVNLDSETTKSFVEKNPQLISITIESEDEDEDDEEDIKHIYSIDPIMLSITVFLISIVSCWFLITFQRELRETLETCIFAYGTFAATIFVKGPAYIFNSF